MGAGDGLRRGVGVGGAGDAGGENDAGLAEGAVVETGCGGKEESTYIDTFIAV